MGTTTTVHRYAVYFAPAANHPLWETGCRWLQRDPLSPDTGWPEPARPHISEPRRYGFHATLKPPFRLREPWSETALLGAVARLASRTPAFDMPVLDVAWLGRFLALRPAQALGADHPLQRLADACVIDLDTFRAPPTDEERARRHSLTLTPQQQALLEAHGYPYVLSEWRFHMTLTDPLDALPGEPRDALLERAREHFGEALGVPMRCDALCLFVEPAPGRPFRLATRFELAR
ncbi:DUF1045 domain-containing protein [Caldimonas mangrovi]|nr:DUF1045 domain-containing protein [Caldimonas mangrovi]